jgi:hypothetical protein
MPVSPEVARKIRSSLRIAVRGAWDTVEGIALRDALAEEAMTSRYADRLKKEAELVQLSSKYRNVANEVGIGKRYKMIYGKPVA